MKKVYICIMMLAVAAAMCGCVWFMKDNGEEQQSTQTYEPVVDEIEVTPEPATPDNPVSGFYSDYYNACDAMKALFQSRLESESSKEAADTLIYLAQHDLMVSEGRVTFGWLLSTDSAGNFSSSVSGAADGSGAISPGIEDTAQEQPDEQQNMVLVPLPLVTPESPVLPEENKDSEYTLEFEFGTGDTLQGTLRNNCLEYSKGEPNGYSVEITTEEGVWVSTVTYENGMATMLKCDGNGLHFTVSKPSEMQLTENVYQWTSDSSGARRI